MFAILTVVLMVATTLLVGASLADSVLRARRAFRRLQLERGQLASFDSMVGVHWRTGEARKAPVKLTLVSSVSRPRAQPRPLAAAA